MDRYQSSSQTRSKQIDEGVRRHLWHTWRERRACRGRAEPIPADAVVTVKYISDISSCLHGRVSTWGGVRKHEAHAPLKKNPLVWSLWNFFARSAQSPSNMVLHPSNNESCKLKSCRILINAGFRPGISRPFLTRRISRIGSMPAPTFSSSPRMKAGWISNAPLQHGKFVHTWSCLRVPQKVFPEVVIILLLRKVDGLNQVEPRKVNTNTEK